MNKKAKSILFRFNMKGVGIVNFDSDGQKWVFKGTNLESKMVRKDKFNQMVNNHNYSKKVFKKINDELSYKLAISSDCLRHNIFKAETQIQSPNLLLNEELFYSFIASPTQLLRGYLFTDKTTYKRSTAIYITPAIQTNDSISIMETFSRSGQKNTDNENQTADNTFFNRETVGDVEYSSYGAIDLMQAQFISASQLFDRFALNPDKFEKYKTYMGLKMPNFNSELDYFIQPQSDVMVPEYGFILSNENLVLLTRMFFKKLRSLSIGKRSAFVNVTSLEYKIVYDPLVDTFYSENDWVSIDTSSDIDKVDFNSEFFYEVTDKDNAKKLLKSVEEAYKIKRDEANKTKEEQREKNRAKKEIKKTEQKIDNNGNQ